MEGIMGRADTPVRALLDEALGMAAGSFHRSYGFSR